MPRRRRVALAAVRAAVIALVILAMLRPTLVYTETKKEKATLVILADDSRSMSVPDALDGKTPLGRACSAPWTMPRLRCGELARDFEVKAYAFDRGRIRPMAIAADGKIALPEKPRGQRNRHRRGPGRRRCGRRPASGCWA